MDNLNVEIITPAEVIFSGKAISITLPGSKSSFQVLSGHSPIVSSLENGKIKIDLGKEEKLFQSSTGFAEVNNNKVSVLVESAQEL
jgi:F-type H+-transporting ATPase subunit epsilon